MGVIENVDKVDESTDLLGRHAYLIWSCKSIGIREYGLYWHWQWYNELSVSLKVSYMWNLAILFCPTRFTSTKVLILFV